MVQDKATVSDYRIGSHIRPIVRCHFQWH